MHGLDGAFCPENNRSFVPLRFSRSHALSHPLGETPSLPVPEKGLELCLKYVNQQKRNNRSGTALIIKVDDILLTYFYATFFFC